MPHVTLAHQLYRPFKTTLPAPVVGFVRSLGTAL
jgi:hypothetical protein